MIRLARALLGVTFASAGVVLASVLAGCPQSQIDIDFGDAAPSSASDGQVVPPGCDLTKDPNASPACIDESIALFVSPSGTADGTGTKAHPFLTIDAALAKADAQHNRVYACEGTYDENVEVSATATASIYGGFGCNDWSDSGKLVKISPSKPGYGVSVIGVASPIVIGDLEIDAQNGQNPGDSSVAAFVSNSTSVTFSNDVINAGSGKNGADGTLVDYLYPTTNAGNANTGMTGGAAVTVTCPSCTTVGGKGGDNGNGGQPGTPQIDGGTGGTPGIIAACGSGGTGGDGDSASAASNGAGALNVGAITASGWMPSAGTQGESGGCGQGGGGGTGESNFGGGSGGAGGCGGASGSPGNGGGGSIGVLIFSSAVTIQKSIITTSTAGNGGKGPAGQPGQAGGIHGTSSGACNGGAGGVGGAGGASGGGAGGVSIGVFYKGSKAPAVDTDTQQKINVPTSGGTKGAGGASGVDDGVDGTAAATLENK